ncbi:MlaD family protein [Chamaesiphon sp. VAR_69_metabat_338]|uniref:MlaD family protein n=1 Tax=Chamaesiphon sp. VAR_69_metabat_338 TaxID=2964704 RepID=UPI00286DF297|nr:MlaD family protein [Chamaesiphon sp. VAR_69_metabat_338]
MQSRAVREGSVGLMLIAGLGIFGAIFLWLRGLTPGSQNYNVVAQFAEAPGLQTGAAVRFRGIRVGKVTRVEPGVNGVEAVMEIDNPNTIVPKDVAVEVSQTGLIGEPVVEITPRSASAINTSTIAKPLDSKCDRNLILCNNSKVNGRVGSSLNELITKVTKLVDAFNSPEIVRNLNSTLVKTGTAAEDFSRLSKNLNKVTNDFSSLPKSVETGLNNLSVKANVLTGSIDRTSTKFGQTADKFNVTAAELTATAAEYKKLATSVNSLVVENRKTFASTLNNFDKLSVDLRKTVNSVNPSIAKLNTTVSKINSDKLAKELESLVSNANQTSINLKNITSNLNDPKTVILLQQTLDSARSTFQNTQKITADLDDLTGNPEFRSNLRNLVNGLGKLVSSTEQLEQQAKLAQTIEPLGKSLDLISKLPIPTSTPANPSQQLDRTQPLLNPQEPFKIDRRWHNSTPKESTNPQTKP